MKTSKNKHAQALGRLGGKARAQTLSGERRREIAKQGYVASPLSSKRAKAESNEKIGKNKV